VANVWDCAWTNHLLTRKVRREETPPGDEAVRQGVDGRGSTGGRGGAEGWRGSSNSHKGV
jgi:hypothetical protein